MALAPLSDQQRVPGPKHAAAPFHNAGSDLDALVAVSVVSHPFEVVPEVVAARRHLFVPAAEGLELPDRLCRPACLDLLEPPVPLCPVRDDRLHGVGYVFEGMEKFEHEGELQLPGR